MSWFLRFTRFATTHLVRAQEKGNSCGINCAMMACCRLNKWTTVADGMNAEAKVYAKYAAHEATYAVPGAGTAYTGTRDTYSNPLRDLMNDLGVGTWESTDVGEDNVAEAIIDSASWFSLSTVPIFVHTNWNTGTAHWVLIDTVFNVFGHRYATVCDPWDGNVHVIPIKKGSAVDYAASKPRLSWSIGSPTYQYVGTSNGRFSGWVVRCTGMDVTSRLGKLFLSANPL